MPDHPTRSSKPCSRSVTARRYPVEFVARSFLPLLGIDAQLELMGLLAEQVAPHV